MGCAASPLPRVIAFLVQLTIPHHTYQFALSTSGRPSPWSIALCVNSPPETRRIKQPFTPLTSSKTSHRPSVSVLLSSSSIPCHHCCHHCCHCRHRCCHRSRHRCHHRRHRCRHRCRHRVVMIVIVVRRLNSHRRLSPLFEDRRTWNSVRD